MRYRLEVGEGRPSAMFAARRGGVTLDIPFMSRAASGEDKLHQMGPGANEKDGGPEAIKSPSLGLLESQGKFLEVVVRTDTARGGRIATAEDSIITPSVWQDEQRTWLCSHHGSPLVVLRWGQHWYCYKKCEVL